MGPPPLPVPPRAVLRSGARHISGATPTTARRRPPARPPSPLPAAGKATVNSMYGTRTAVLVGDFLFAQSSWFLANLDNLEVGCFWVGQRGGGRAVAMAGGPATGAAWSMAAASRGVRG